MVMAEYPLHAVRMHMGYLRALNEALGLFGMRDNAHRTLRAACRFPTGGQRANPVWLVQPWARRSADLYEEVPMPLSIEEAITQLDNGWLRHLQSQGYGGDALRNAIELVLYAQQQAAARNSAELKAAVVRVNRLMGPCMACDNVGDFMYTAEWRDPANPELAFALEYAAEPSSWRAEFRMPGRWPHTYDNLDITDTRAVDHDFGLWLARISARHFTHLMARQAGEFDDVQALCAAAVRPTRFEDFQQRHPLAPQARAGDRPITADWHAAYAPKAKRSLHADFDFLTALLLRLMAVQQAVHAEQAPPQAGLRQPMYRSLMQTKSARKH